MLRTALCKQLGIDHPVFSAGIGPAASAALAAAVSNAGACGVLGGGGAGGAYVREQVRRLRALTDRPFGVNIILGDEEPEAEAIAACIAERVPIVVLFWGIRVRSWRTPIGRA